MVLETSGHAHHQVHEGHQLQVKQGNGGERERVDQWQVPMNRKVQLLANLSHVSHKQVTPGVQSAKCKRSGKSGASLLEFF